MSFIRSTQAGSSESLMETKSYFCIWGVSSMKTISLFFRKRYHTRTCNKRSVAADCYFLCQPMVHTACDRTFGNMEPNHERFHSMEILDTGDHSLVSQYTGNRCRLYSDLNKYINTPQPEIPKPLSTYLRYSAFDTCPLSVGYEHLFIDLLIEGSLFFCPGRSFLGSIMDGALVLLKQ
jgi:hypothetical protein